MQRNQPGNEQPLQKVTLFSFQIFIMELQKEAFKRSNNAEDNKPYS